LSQIIRNPKPPRRKLLSLRYTPTRSYIPMSEVCYVLSMRRGCHSAKKAGPRYIIRNRILIFRFFLIPSRSGWSSIRQEEMRVLKRRLERERGTCGNSIGAVVRCWSEEGWVMWLGLLIVEERGRGVWGFFLLSFLPGSKGSRWIIMMKQQQQQQPHRRSCYATLDFFWVEKSPPLMPPRVSSAERCCFL
jgi:hypothetical protein